MNCAQGASEELVEAAGILCDRLVAGFLGFDLRPDEVPFHIRKVEALPYHCHAHLGDPRTLTHSCSTPTHNGHAQDMPLAQRMGATAEQPEATAAAVPGSVPSPKADEVSTSHEDVKLRGFIQQPDAEKEQQVCPGRRCWPCDSIPAFTTCFLFCWSLRRGF